MRFPAAGRLRDKVAIQKRAAVEGAYGNRPDTWITVNTRRCSIEPINGKEYFSSQGERNQNALRIRFRNEKGLLKTSYRLVDQRVSPNRFFDIESLIDPNNEHSEIIAMCLERL